MVGRLLCDRVLTASYGKLYLYKVVDNEGQNMVARDSSISLPLHNCTLTVKLKCKIFQSISKSKIFRFFDFDNVN